MRKSYHIIITVLILFSSFLSFSSPQMEDDSVTMGAGYANDIYYSIENGEIESVARTNWDIGFYTVTWSAGIIINDGNGVELYLYPNTDTSGWNSIDTSGLSTWPALFNSTLDWEEGAFNRNQLGHPDYGWGVYNTITHDVVGDSLYIIRLADGTFKKFHVIKKVSIANTYYFRYSNLDGTDEVNKILDCSGYEDKNFIYYSLVDESILDREPNSESWDILFTKYMGELEGGVPYPVTGVLNNVHIPANRFEGVMPDFEDWSALPMDSTKSPIGYDWKYFDMETFTYIVEDSLAFFISNFKKDVYKLVFSVFDYTSGKVVFSKSKVHSSNIGEFSNHHSFKIFPNPAKDILRIDLTGSKAWNEITISDLSGKVIVKLKAGQQDYFSIPINHLSTGMYMVTVSSGSSFTAQKLFIYK